MGSRVRKYSIAFAALAALTLAGCPKKESPEDVELAAQQARKAAQDKKKVDVFDEFYMDDAKKSPDADKGKGKGKDKGKGKVEAPAAAEPPKELAAAGGVQNFSKNGRYVVQVNSTASESGATKMAAKLKNLGYPAYVVSVQNPTPELIGTYFRVRVGGFDSYSEAKAFAEGTLASAGYDYWIDRRANDNVGIQGSGFGSAGGQQQYPAAPPQQQYQQAPPPQQQYRPAPQQQYQPAPAPAQQAAPQQYRPAPPPPPPQQYQQTPQQYQPAPAPAQQAAPQQYRPAPAPAQQAAPAPAQGAQPAARPPQAAPPPAAPAPQPAARPQQQQPAPAPAAPAPQPAAKPAPAKPANDWGTADDWGTGDW